MQMFLRMKLQRTDFDSLVTERARDGTGTDYRPVRDRFHLWNERYLCAIQPHDQLLLWFMDQCYHKRVRYSERLISMYKGACLSIQNHLIIYYSNQYLSCFLGDRTLKLWNFLPQLKCFDKSSKGLVLVLDGPILEMCPRAKRIFWSRAKICLLFCREMFAPGRP